MPITLRYLYFCIARLYVTSTLQHTARPQDRLPFERVHCDLQRNFKKSNLLLDDPRYEPSTTVNMHASNLHHGVVGVIGSQTIPKNVLKSYDRVFSSKQILGTLF